MFFVLLVTQISTMLQFRNEINWSLKSYPEINCYLKWQFICHFQIKKNPRVCVCEAFQSVSFTSRNNTTANKNYRVSAGPLFPNAELSIGPGLAFDPTPLPLRRAWLMPKS